MGRNRIKTLDDSKQEIIEMYSSKNSGPEIAHKFNVSHSTILSRLREWSIPIRRRGWGRIKILDDNKEKIIELYNSGEHMWQIAKKFNISCGSILNRLVEWNIPRRKPGIESYKTGIAYKNKDTIISFYTTGLSMQAIGNFFNVSRQRIHQLLKQWQSFFMNREKT